MAVFRVERTENYTIMSNYHLRDKSISLKAKELLSQMLSLPEDWDYTLTGLAKINQEGKDAIRAAVTELERARYIRCRQTVDRAGKFSNNEYIIQERPVSALFPPAGPPSAIPSSGNPTTGHPAAEYPAQIKKERQKKEKQTTDLRKKESLSFPSAPFLGTKEAKGRKRRREKPMDRREMDTYRDLIRESIRYGDFVRERPWDAGQLDEMVELMAETVCSNREIIRVCGNELPQAVVKSRLLKLGREHIRFVFDCLRDNTTQIHNIRQYLLATLYNAPATMENYYAARSTMTSTAG